MTTARRAIVTLLAAAALSSGLAPQADAAFVTRSGTMRATATLTIKSTIPASATINGVVTIGYTSPDYSQQQSISTSATLTRTGNTAKLDVTLPYSFVLNGSDLSSTQLTVDFDVSASSGGDTDAGVPIAVPANGATIYPHVNVEL